MSYLRRLSAVFRTDDSFQDLNAHALYLKNKADMLALHERHVILLLDEIHVSQACAYKCGRVVDMACKAVENEASTVQTFMITSLLRGNKDVAAMIPVKTLNASYLA